MRLHASHLIPARLLRGVSAPKHLCKRSSGVRCWADTAFAGRRTNQLGRHNPIFGRGPAAAALAAKGMLPVEGAARILAAATLQSPGGTE